MRSSRRGNEGRRRPAAPIAGVALAAALAGGFAIEATTGALPGFVSAESRLLRDRLNADAPELAPVYEARRFEPIWVDDGKVRPEARALIAAITSAHDDGLDPERYGLSQLKQELIAAQTGEARALARFEMQASKSFVDYILDLHTPTKGEQMVYTDPEAAPPAMTRLSILQAASTAPSLGEHLASARRMNPIYEDLRRALARHRAAKGPRAMEQLLLVNLDRARALPANPGRRYIVVDTPSATLWMYENGRPVDSMKVIVGKRDDPTPHMAGMIRYALFNPYWNVPEDIIRDSIAPQVVSGGPGVIAARELQVLSDWSPQARVLDPSAVDWRAVAAGEYQRVRQLPGPANMMGKVKFMLPNELGIYLHDTPNKAHFTQEDRWFSAGCVRLEDADRLARWMFGNGYKVEPTPDYRLDLKQPIPVYMTYFTVAPGGGAAQTRRDVYGWDMVSIASRAARERAA
jgi:murein L,D-transpeptidase YcbB/YkuD